jgi:hypothetical protein
MEWNRARGSPLHLSFILVEVLEGIDRRRILWTGDLAGLRLIF